MPQVLCILESTEPWRISPPVLSRCIYKEVRSWKNSLKAEAQPPSLEGVLEAWNKGEDPITLLQKVLETKGFVPQELVLEAYRRWGNGMSPWLLLAWLVAENKAAVPSVCV